MGFPGNMACVDALKKEARLSFDKISVFVADLPAPAKHFDIWGQNGRRELPAGLYLVNEEEPFS